MRDTFIGLKAHIQHQAISYDSVLLGELLWQYANFTSPSSTTLWCQARSNVCYFHSALDIWHWNLALDIWHWTSGTGHLALDIWHWTSGSQWNCVLYGHTLMNKIADLSSWQQLKLTFTQSGTSIRGCLNLRHKEAIPSSHTRGRCSWLPPGHLTRSVVSLWSCDIIFWVISATRY